MTKQEQTDFLIGPEITDFNATKVRVEYNSDAGASYLAEHYGPGVIQVAVVKSAIPKYVGNLSLAGLTHRIAEESEMTTDYPA